MKAVQTLRDEHKNILRMLKVVKSLAIITFNTKEVYYEGYRNAIEFIRNYADKFHHGKEEDILFKKMSSELGPAIEKGPIFGMLAEHDLGRLFIKTLEDALIKAEKGDEDAKVDIIANATAYTDLLYRHIDKEDNAIFNFADSQLKPETHEELNIEFENAKKGLNSDETERKYIALLEELEAYVASAK